MKQKDVTEYLSEIANPKIRRSALCLKKAHRPSEVLASSFVESVCYSFVHNSSLEYFLFPGHFWPSVANDKFMNLPGTKAMLRNLKNKTDREASNFSNRLNLIILSYAKHYYELQER